VLACFGIHLLPKARPPRSKARLWEERWRTPKQTHYNFSSSGISSNILNIYRGNTSRGPWMGSRMTTGSGTMRDEDVHLPGTRCTFAWCKKPTRMSYFPEELPLSLSEGVLFRYTPGSQSMGRMPWIYTQMIKQVCTVHICCTDRTSEMTCCNIPNT